jgi:hypothetical protein
VCKIVEMSFFHYHGNELSLSWSELTKAKDFEVEKKKIINDTTLNIYTKKELHNMRVYELLI